ncbi:MAG: adenylate/guanylate cyclase domain-containing protein [Geminicoccaceae bacterium]|jgi:adenylate cyclase|nr:adenylate/guanylate cyclase domain-containing protein [Geminicoccaceae bacterium]
MARRGWLDRLRGATDDSSAALIRATLESHEERNLKRLTIARSLMFLAIFFWLGFNYGWSTAADNAVILLAFIANGLVAYALARGRSDRRWVPLAVTLVDAILLGFTLLAPGRTYPGDWPWATVLRQPSFLYFLLLPAIASLSFRPIAVLWSAFCVGLVWAVGTMLIVHSPGTSTTIPNYGEAGPEASASQLAAYLSPHYVHVDDAVVRIFLTFMIAAILAFGAYRARRLMLEQAEVVRQRANLARYVAPNMVEALARTDRPMGEVRTHSAAVLFADIKGFTALAEAGSPEETMRLLREFHGRMANCVFALGGTFDKFIGDGLMATFGTPEPAADDADRALACGRAMLAAIADWRQTRTALGEAPVEVGIGIHFGPVVMGDIGGGEADQRFEFAVIGDTVNVASRLERLTRSVDRPLLVSEALCRALQAPADDLEPLGPHHLDGRAGQVEVWAVNPADERPGCRDRG